VLFEPQHRFGRLFADFLDVDVGGRRNVCVAQNLLDGLQIHAQAFKVGFEAAPIGVETVPFQLGLRECRQDLLSAA